MAAHVQIIRCKNCKRRFYASENACPECGRKSTKGRLMTAFVIASIAVALAVAVKLAIFMAGQTTKLERLPEASDGK